MALPISFNINLDDHYSQVAAKVTFAQKKFNDTIKKGDDKLKKYNDTLKKTGRGAEILARKNRVLKKRFTDLKGEAIGLGATLLAVAFPIKQAIRFESAMSDVRKVVEFKTIDNFRKFGDQILVMSQQLPVSADGLAAMAAAGGKLGIKAAELPGFIKTVTKATVAWDMSSEMAADSLANLSNRMGIPIDKIEELADAINFMTDSTSAKVPALLQILGRLSGEFTTLGVSSEKAVGFATFAALVEVTPQLAASGFRQMLQRMRDIPKMTEKLVKNPEKAITGLLSRLSDLGTLERIKLIDEIFGPEAGKFVLKATAKFELLGKTLEKVADKQNFLGSLQREFNIKSETTSKKLQLMKNRFAAVGIKLGEAFLPILKVTAAVLGTIAIALFAVLVQLEPIMPLIGSLVGIFVVLKTAALLTRLWGIAMGFLKVNALAALSPTIKAIGFLSAAIIFAVDSIIKFKEQFTFSGLAKKFLAGELSIGDAFRSQESFAAKNREATRKIFENVKSKNIIPGAVNPITGVANPVPGPVPGPQKISGSVDTNINVSATAGTRVNSVETTTAGAARTAAINMNTAGAFA